MKHIYETYKRTLNGVPTYFVKRFQHFPELSGSPQVQDGYGMHTDFIKACRIAGITDTGLIESLRARFEDEVHAAKVIDLLPPGRTVQFNK